jgi:hypothetical protein
MKLSAEQQRAVQKLSAQMGGFAWWRVGEGKTRIALAWLATLARDFKLNSFIVVIRPNSFQTWEDEIRECGLDWQINTRWLDQSLSMADPAKVSLMLFSSGKLDSKLEDALWGEPQAVVFDEGWMFKNVSARRTKAAHALAAKCNWRALLLSGSLMTANDVEDIWGQAWTIGKQHSLAKNLTEFRSKHKIYFPGTHGGMAFSTKAGAREKIISDLTSCADIHFPSNSERTIHERKRLYDQTDEQRVLISTLKRDYLATLASDSGERVVDVKNAAHLISVVQQISNGWVRTEGGGVERVNSTKLSALLDIVDELVAANERCLIWCAFRYDVELLSSILPHKHVTMRGGEPFDVATWKNRATKVCIATEASGSSVNHFAQVGYAIYFSMSFKWHDLQQSKGRTDRKSSAHTACYYDYLFTRGTFDSYIFASAQKAGRSEQHLIDSGEFATWLNENPSHSGSETKINRISSNSKRGAKKTMSR